MKVFLVSLLLIGVAWAASAPKPKLSCECGKRNAGRIVGGKETKKNEYPWMIAIRTRTNSFTFCGGAIVTPWHVITAAHCVWTKTAAELVVMVGAHDVNDVSDPNRKLHAVEESIIHPSYSNVTQANDLAIIVVEVEIAFNDVVGPHCMPSKLMGAELVGQVFKAMGWGRYDPGKANTDKIKNLREVDLNVVSHKDCDKTQICTYSPGKDVCMGDSGGPLSWLDPDVNRFTLAAIVSYGPSDCGNKEGRPGVNTNISYHLTWINGIISRKKGVATCHKQ